MTDPPPGGTGRFADAARVAAALLATRLSHGRLASPFTARDVYRQEWTGLTEPRVVQGALSKNWAGFARRRSGPRTGGGPRCASTSTRGSAPTGIPDRAP